MLPYVSVNTSALILSIFWNACSPTRAKFLLPAIFATGAPAQRRPPLTATRQAPTNMMSQKK